MFIKKCIVCNKEFSKPSSDSKKTWIKRKYCSIICTNIGFKGKRVSPKTEFKKGRISENKGKKLPEISREKHGMWKGGKTQKLVGYILIKQADHPYCDSQGYVREHRLVMEKYLGRYLEPKEVVHHINEIKDDNRLENLMLFSNNGEHTRYHKLYLN